MCEHAYARWRPRTVTLESGELAVTGWVLVCADVRCFAVVGTSESPPYETHVALHKWMDGAYHARPEGPSEWIF